MLKMNYSAIRLKIKLATIIIIIVITMITLSKHSIAQEKSPDYYLQKYKELLDSFSVVSFTGLWSDYDESHINVINTMNIDYFIDLKRGQYYHYKKPGQESFVLSFRNQNQETLFSYDPDLADSDKYSILSYTKIPEKSLNESIRLLYFSYPFGYFRDGKEMISLLETLNHAKNRITFKDAKPCLNAITNEFEIDIIFNHNKNYCPERIHIRRLNPSDSPEHGDLFEYNVTEYSNVDGKWFPCKYTVAESFPGGYIKYNTPPGVTFGGETGKNLLPSKLFAEVTLTDMKIIKAIPDKYFKLPTNIPNGTCVYMQDDIHHKYIWLDGKIVPLTDERMLAIAQGGHKFMPSPKEARFWLILLGVIGILGGGGWKLYHFWTSDRKPT